MRNLYRRSDEIREQSHMRVRLEKARIVRIECRVQDFLYAWHVDFGVFDRGMISMHQHGCESHQQKKSKFFDRRIVFQITNL